MKRGTESSELVYGVHPVTELVESRVQEIERIWVARESSGRLGRVLRRARHAGIPVSYLSRSALASKIGARAAHQGIAVQIAAFAYSDADEICKSAAEREDALLVLVDRVSDPGNLGAMLRTCAGAGVHGVLLSADDTAGLTAHVAKASAGTLGRVPVAREPRPGPRIRGLRELGFRAMILDPRGSSDWAETDLRGRMVVVAGGESRGARPGVRDACSIRVAVPLAPGVESLNVAVSLGVLLFEAVRQRRFPA